MAPTGSYIIRTLKFGGRALPVRSILAGRDPLRVDRCFVVPEDCAGDQ
jgi:hypothetical protein